jgi:calcineurin-like phosphoesterase family protein
MISEFLPERDPNDFVSHRLLKVFLIAILASISAHSLANASALDAPESSVSLVVLGDRTGGHRPGVFEYAVERAAALNPDRVLSVGDLIEGYSDSPDVIDEQWQEIEDMLTPIRDKLIAAPGNHDISSVMTREQWRSRFGSTYQAQRINDVLVIALNTEDPPVVPSPDILQKTLALEAAMARDPDGTQARLLAMAANREAPVDLPGDSHLSEAQRAWVLSTLEANDDVALTILLMHKPAWRNPDSGFAAIEAAVQGRETLIIAGHEHYFEEIERNGIPYIIMGTCGGIWLRDGPGRLDHILQITSVGGRYSLDYMTLNRAAE